MLVVSSLPLFPIRYKTYERMKEKKDLDNNEMFAHRNLLEGEDHHDHVVAALVVVLINNIR